MLERAIGRTSERYRRASKLCSNHLNRIAVDGGKLQGEGLEEFLEGTREMNRWSTIIGRAEMLAGSALISGSILLGRGETRRRLFAAGCLLVADGALGLYRSLSYDVVEEAVAGRSYLDMDLIQEVGKEF